MCKEVEDLRSATETDLQPGSIDYERYHLTKAQADAQEISMSQWHELLNGESCGGKTINFTVFPPVLADPKIPEPSPEEMKMMAEGKRQSLMDTTATAMVPLQDVVDLNIATEAEKRRLEEWKFYRVQLLRVDMEKPVWPVPPEDDV